MGNSFDYGNDIDGIETALVGIMGVVSVFLVIFLIISVFVIVGRWKAYKKAGKPGWAAIVPFYNNIVACQIGGITPWWVLIVAVGGSILNLIPFLGSILSLIISIYFLIILNIGVAKSYGKDGGFAVGLILLAPVFWMILGFSKDIAYVGSAPTNDFLTKKLNENKGQNPNPNSNYTNNPNYMNTGQNQNNNFANNQGYMNNNQNPNNNYVNNQGYMNNNQSLNNNYTTGQEYPNNNQNSNVYNDSQNQGIQGINNNFNQQSSFNNDSVFCPNCGTKLASDEIFCPNCGTKVK